MIGQPIDILIVEDEPAHAEAIRRSLLDAETPMEIRVANSLSEFRNAVALRSPNLVLLDLLLPDGRADAALVSPPEAGQFPMVLMTSHGDEQIAVAAIRNGALDYVVKSPDAFANMPRTVERTLREWQTLLESRQARKALAVREEIFSNIISQAADAIVLFDASTLRFIEFNSAAHEGLGYTREEFARLGVVGIQVDHSLEVIQRKLDEVRQRGELSFEARQRHHDGSFRDAYVRIRPLQIQGYDYMTAVSTDITERKRAEAQAAREAMRTEFLLELHQSAPHMTDKELFDHVLERAVQLTESSIGFFHRISEDQRSVLLTTWNQEALKNCTAAYDTHYPLNQAGNWVDCVRQQQPVVYNDYAHSPSQRGLPPGHTAVNRFMSIPVVRNGQVLIIFGVGNKAVDYTDDDVKQLQVVANELHKIMVQREDRDHLRQSEERFRQLVETTSDVIWETDAANRFSYVSPKIRDILGYAPEEIEGRTPYDFMPPVEAHRVRDVFSGMFDERKPLGNLENICHHKDGHEVVLETSGVPVLGPNGQLLGYRGIDRDITERKQAEAALAKREEQLSIALDMAHAGYWEFDVLNDRFIFNDHFYNIFHTTVEAVGGYQLSSDEYLRRFCHPDDRLLVGKAIQATLSSTYPDYSHQFEHRIIYADGGVGYISVKYYITKDVQGRTIRAYGVNQDITERRKTEEERAQLAAAIEQAAEAIIITDVQGTIQYVNPAFEKITGYGRREAVGSNPRILKGGQHQDAFYRQLWTTITNGETWHGRFTNKRKDGTLFEEDAVISPIRDVSGTITNFVAAKRDITHEQKLEQQLQQAQKMESIGRLAGGVAHDFNNMLGIILGYTAMAMDEVDPASSLHDDLNEVRKAAERSANLTRQLLAFARKQTASPRVLDLNNTVDGMIKMLKRLIGEDIDLSWEPGAEVWPVKIDPSQIDQILANLCVNARDAIEGVGKLTISTENVLLDEAHCLEHVGFVPGEYVLLTVGDNGCGMDKETVNNIFEPFFTTKAVGKGTGLGLSTVYGIVSQNKGLINVNSEPRLGTIFEIYLPRHQFEADLKQKEDLSQSFASGHETILLVEDDPSVLAMTTKMLERLGYTVLSATTPNEAMLLAGKHAEEIDLLMTDVVMPEMNGLDLGKKLLARYPSLKQLFVSGYTADIIARHGVLVEGIHFIQKPLSRPAVAAKLRELFSEGD